MGRKIIFYTLIFILLFAAPVFAAFKTDNLTITSLLSKTSLATNSDGKVIEGTGGAGYTDENAQDAIGLNWTDTPSIDFTYNDAGNAHSAAINATYVGQSSITTLGTIATGVWNGTAVAKGYGGTGAANFDNLIALTYNTTGNYVATVAGTANQIIVAGADAEGATKTLSLPQSINTTSSVDFAAITEGSNAVYNSTEVPGGELGGTWASPTIDADAVLYNEIGDAGADATIAMGANEIDWTSTIDAAGEAVLTITNTDADAANSNTLLTLSHNDGADVNVFYLSTIADADGSPLTTFSLQQTATVGAIGMNLGATGVVFSDDADGALTIQGASAGFDETIIVNLDDTDNQAVWTGTAVTWDMSAIDIIYKAVSIEAGALVAASVDGDDINSNLAGRSLTLTGASPDTLDADAELYTDTKCIYWESPVATDDFKSIWYSPTAMTLTQIWAESDQTVTFMLQVDDGSPADVDSVDLAPAAGVASDTSLDGDTTMAAGDRLDMAVTSVSGTPTWCSVCWTYTKDD